MSDIDRAIEHLRKLVKDGRELAPRAFWMVEAKAALAALERHQAASAELVRILNRQPEVEREEGDA